MRTIRIHRDLLDRIEVEARAGYPEEACGFLCSPSAAADAPERIVSSVEGAANEVVGERRRRFVIMPEGLRAAEERASARAEVVSGFYHSHPDHPALPSTFDTDHAWPWYTYLVVSVDGGGACTSGAFELEAERRRFVPCELAVDPGSSPRPEASAARAAGR